MPIPKLLVSAGLMAANMALTMTRKIEGPRLDDLKFTSGDYGAPLPMIWGMRRQQCPIFWGEPLREVKRRRKTKGGKFNEYSYFGTWAVALAGHEIDAVRRIWFDTHLVYDMTGAGPVTPFDFGDVASGKGSGGAGTGGFSPAANIAIYYGTETQTADPRMEATVEAAHGEGSCPAYRGTAYIVFKDVPLEKLGNRIPQVAVEIISNRSDIQPTSTITCDYETGWLAFTGDYSFLLAGSYTGYSFIDNAAGAVAISSAFDNVEDSGDNVAVLTDGTILAPAGAGVALRSFSPEGAFLGDVGDTSGISVYGVLSCTDIYGEDHWITQDLFATDLVSYNGVVYDLSTETGTAFYISTLFADDFGGVWIGGRTNSSGLPSASTTAVFYRINHVGDGPDYVEVPGLPSASTTVRATHYSDATHDQFVFHWAGDIYAADRLTGTILASNTTVPAGPAEHERAWRFIPPGATSMWAGFTEISLADLTTIRALDSTDWGVGSTTPALYDPVNHALIVTSGTTVKYCYLDRVGSNGVLLGDILADLAVRCDVTDYDFTDLDQVVKGWSATRGQASNMVEPLLDAFDSDVRPHEFTLEGVKRSGVTSGASLLTERFVAGNPRYTAKVRQAADLPRAVTISFADMEAEQQPNNVRADRPLDATGARGERQIDLSTLASDADEARGLAERYFRRLWNERREVSLSLTAQQLALEPGDCRVLDLDGESDTYRCVSLTVKADDTLATEWKYDHPSLAGLSGAAGAPFDGREPDVIAVPLLSRAFILDIPYLSDVDANVSPLLYMGAAPYATGSWPGATIYQAVDGEYSEEETTVASSSPVTWGFANGVLPETNPNVWDRGSSVNVTLQYGSLTGTTEAAIDADPTLNLMLIGDELVNFTTATLEGDGSYTLSGFKRGRRGTEWACGTHADRDVVLMADRVQDVAQGLSDVGTAMSFKALTSGRTTGFAESLTFTGASLKPYAPCHLEAVKESNGDWTLTWVRRTRVGGAWTSGTTIPLSETSEEYEVEILNGSTVVRTITGLTSATATWTDAQQVTDFGSTQASVSWRIYQISASVDRGFAAAA